VTAIGEAPTGVLPALEPLEVASGMIFGPRRSAVPEELRWNRPEKAGPRDLLEHMLLDALRRSPCVVAFSGGRDSSAVLAEAVRVARKHGLEDPIPHTVRFSHAPKTDELEWQQLVVRHLKLREWSEKVVTDELDALGDIATDFISRYGVHWPPNIHADQLLLEPAMGGALITGNGGDELLVPWLGHRVARLRRLRGLPDRQDLKALLFFSAPKWLMVERAIRKGQYRLPWLTSSAAREVQRQAALDTLRLKRSWAEELEFYLASRYIEVALPMTGAMASDAGVHLVEPFFEPCFIRAVCADAPPEGYPSRTAAMAKLFGDVLPARVVQRPTKATFTEVFCGPRMRDFARTWDGAGVDPELVEPELLREQWLSATPDFRSLILLQAAWVHGA
jgi:asparagine synthase (glutamine-hydrolysing)